MKHAKPSQSGFAIMAILLLVVAIAAIGGAGYVVYRTRSAADATAANAVSQRHSTAVQNANSDYLVVKSWGIRVKIPQANRLSYVMTSSPGGDTPDGSGQYVDSIALSLADSVTTDASCKKLGIGIDRAKLITATSPLPTVGQYVFSVTGSPFSCGNAQLDAIRATYTGDNPSSWTFSAD